MKDTNDSEAIECRNHIAGNDSEFCFNAQPMEEGREHWFRCSECGHECDGYMLWKCPGCGRPIL